MNRVFTFKVELHTTPHIRDGETIANTLRDIADNVQRKIDGDPITPGDYGAIYDPETREQIGRWVVTL